MNIDFYNYKDHACKCCGEYKLAYGKIGFGDPKTNQLAKVSEKIMCTSCFEINLERDEDLKINYAH